MARSGIIRAAKSIPGGARPTPAPQGLAPTPGNLAGYQGGMSPLSAQLDTGGATGTWQGAYPGYLPRPTETFTEGAFGPFSPILPVPVDAPADGSEMPDPRLYQYQVGWNLPVGQPGSEGIKMCNFDTLRTLADLYSVARACIQLRKAEVRAIEWDILPTSDAAKNMRNDRDSMKDFGERRAKAVKFFSKPDPDYFSWSTFLDAFLEEVFVFDAPSILFRKKWAKGRGRGVLGSDLDSLSLINGPTIRPLVGMHGERPRPPAPAYQQYLYGVPRCDLMTLISEKDLEDGLMTGAEMNRFRADSLLYHPMNPRRWTPYGFPPIERALVPVISGLQKQGWQLDYFREGTVPAVYIAPGDTNQNMTPNQIRELQDALNAVAGDPAWHHKIIVLPSGSKVMPQRQQELADQFDEIVMNQVCMAFDVQPMELGISPKVSTTQSPGAANQMARSSQDIHQRKATKPLLKYLSEIMDYVLTDLCGQDDMRFVFEGLEEKEDEATQTEMLIAQVGAGMRSIDEARDVLNLQPWGLPETSDPGWNIPASGWIPLADAVQAHKTGNIIGPMFEMNAPTVPGTPAAPGVPGAPVPGVPGAPGSGVAQVPGGPGVKPAPAPLVNAPDVGETPDAAAVEPAVEADDAPADDASSDDAAPAATAAHEQASGNVEKPTAKDKPADADKSAHHPPAVHHQVRRHSRVSGAISDVTRRLDVIVGAYRHGEMDAPAAVDKAVSVLAAGYRGVSAKARRDAVADHSLTLKNDDFDVDDDDEIDDDGSSTQKAEGQRPFLMGLIKAVAGGLLTVSGRIGLYGRSLNAAYNKSYGETVRSSPDRFEIIWHLGITEHCKMCLGYDGQTFTFDDLPGYPGEGGFGATCYGGPNCGCSLEYIKVEGDPDWYSPQPSNIASGVRVFNKGIESELSALIRHMRKGRLISTWEPRHIDNELLARVAENHAKGMSPDEAVAAAKAVWRVDLNGQGYWDDTKPGGSLIAPTSAAGGGGRQFPAHDVNGIETTDPHPGASLDDQHNRWRVSGAPMTSRPGDPEPNAGRVKKSGPAATAPDPKGATPAEADPDAEPGKPATAPPVAAPAQTATPANPASNTQSAAGAAPVANVPDPGLKQVDAEHVLNQLRANYPESAISWVKTMPWVGPVLIPINRIDMDDVDEWAATKEPDRVDHFVQEIQSGQSNMHPVIAVQEPTDSRISIIDGHHRVLAYMKLNQPIRAYVGFAPADKGPWKETHSSQIHQGADAANKMQDYRIEPDCPCGMPVMFDPENGWQHADGSISHDDGESVSDKTGLWSKEPAKAAGVAVVAMDTGRVLMLQRSYADTEDPAAGDWEFPGGCLEDGEDPMSAAVREWCEETGCDMPPGTLVGRWGSGVYRGYVWAVASEDAVPIFDGRDQVSNPDDPDGDAIEALAWWELSDLPGNPAIRQELADDIAEVMEALRFQQ